jgi:hypothetical protein
MNYLKTKPWLALTTAVGIVMTIATRARAEPPPKMKEKICRKTKRVRLKAPHFLKVTKRIIGQKIQAPILLPTTMKTLADMPVIPNRGIRCIALLPMTDTVEKNKKSRHETCFFQTKQTNLKHCIRVILMQISVRITKTKNKTAQLNPTITYFLKSYTKQALL